MTRARLLPQALSEITVPTVSSRDTTASETGVPSLDAAVIEKKMKTPVKKINMPARRGQGATVPENARNPMTRIPVTQAFQTGIPSSSE
jgi:hypothetical protein